MCGIIGYVGSRACKGLILTGLERSEYRGYDSAGMVLVEDDRLDRARTIGGVANLRELVGDNHSVATTGMGHTRWATHGGVRVENAHPFLSSDGRFAVLMNGIVENYEELRRELRGKGYEFSSDTDTEVLVHLLTDVYDGDLVEAVRKVYGRLEGHFAFLFLARDEPDRIVAARLAWPPLVVGRGEGETFIASFTPAFLAETRMVQYVPEAEIVEITAAGSLFYPVAGGPAETHPIEVTDESLEVAEMGGYDTFMLKEIYEQPTAVADTIGERLHHGRLNLDGMGLSDEELAKIDRVLIVACGTALHAGLVGRYLLEDWAGIATESDYASEWRYRGSVFAPGTLVLAISQSGETADTIAAMRLARERGARVIAITNIMGSAVTREADGVLYTRAGLEVSVASTKAFTSQVALVTLLALKLAEVRGALPQERIDGLAAEIELLPAKIQQLLDDPRLESGISAIAEEFAHDRFFLFLGRHMGLPICLEGALKLKEITYIPSDAYAAGEMKHGPIALLGEDTPVVAVATDSHIFDKLVSNLQEVKARGAKVIAIATEGNERISEHAAHVIYVPRTVPELQPILATIPLQLMAYAIARALNLNVDRPRNLAKTVTVE